MIEANGDRLPGLTRGVKLIDLISDNFDNDKFLARSKSESKSKNTSSFLTIERSQAKLIDHKLAIFEKNKTSGLL